MEIHELLTDFRTSGNKTFYIDYFLQNQKEIKDLVSIIVNEEKYPYPEYASWLLIHIQKANPSLVKPYQNQLSDVLLKSKNQSVLRNCCSVVQLMGKTDYREGELLLRFVDFVKSNENKVALQVHSLYCLIEYVKQYPELKEELKTLANLTVNERTAAYKVAVRNFLEAIRKI